MKNSPVVLAAIAQPTPQDIVLSGAWTALGMGSIEQQLATMQVSPQTPSENAPNARLTVDGAGIETLDTAGAWLLHKLLLRLKGAETSAALTVQGLRPEFTKLMDLVAHHFEDQATRPTPAARPSPTVLGQVGRSAAAAYEQAVALLGFVGETAYALLGSFTHPARFRWRPILFNIRSAGVDALPIVGMMSFMLGVVVAYQGAAQLRQYGANIFVADLVGLSMLREFAPLITAIIIAGRSGSAYAAQIGTMAVTEEIDAMRTIGIAPLEMLVLPKLIALVIVMPLLTLFADVLGVFGGMIMAQAQLGVTYVEFSDRFVKAVSITSYAIGIGKAPVFAAIIVMIGCFQGFRTKGGADSVGRQTTRSVVQSIFLVILADGLFSVIFSALDI